MAEQERDELGRFVASDAIEPDVVESDETEQPDPEAEAQRAELEAEARKFGWKPREEWRTKSAERTPEDEGWAPADKFISLPTTQVKMYRAKEKAWEERERSLNERLGGIERTTAEAVRRAREQERAEWEARVIAARREQAEAVESADREKWQAARTREEQLYQQAPQHEPVAAPVPDELRQYGEANAWTKNDEAVRYGVTLIDNTPHIRALRGVRQLKAVEAEVRKVFPDLFQEEAPPPTQPQRPSFSRVDGGGLAGMNRGKSIADLPREAQEAYAMFQREGIKMTEAEYIKHYMGQS